MERPSRGIPGIEKNQTEAGEVFHVPCDECQAVFKGRCGNQAVGNVQRPAGKLPLPIEHAPSLGDRPCNRQDTVVEPGRNLLLNHPLKLRQSRTPLGEECDSPAQLTHRHDADKQRVVCLPLKPGRDACVRTGPQHFGRNVGIEEKPAHDRSMGRPVEGLRPKSSSPSANNRRTGAKSSTRSLASAGTPGLTDAAGT